MELKPLFVERMKKLLPGKEFEKYLKSLDERPLNSIRCNTLKISPEDLKKRLEKKHWIVEQPFEEHKEIMIIKNKLEPGELGRALEHMLGYYYIQEIASMLPILALKPGPEDMVLDLAASPGSKTTEIAAMMRNEGTVIANEVSLGRIKILASNLERCGVTNAIITKKEGGSLCKRLSRESFEFDKILIDAPCSGEGTLKSSPKTARMWNPKTIKTLSRIQKSLIMGAFEILKPGGELVYSTCTHAPEENEAVIDFFLKNFKDKMKIEKLSLPVKCRPGLVSWEGENYDKEIKNSCRIYPQDNATEGFFIAKLKKIK